MNKESKVYDIHSTSDYVNDILDKTPNWIISWANTYFLLFIILLLLLTTFIKYPDTIIAEVKITTKNPTVSVPSNSRGELKKLFHGNNDTIQKNDVIAIIQSNAKLDDIFKLKKTVYELSLINEPINYLKFKLEEDLILDELTQEYAILKKELFDYKFYLNNDIVFKRINSLQREINKKKDLNISLKKQQKLFLKQFELTEKNYNRNVILNKKGVISDLEKEKIEASYLIEKRQLENFYADQINNEIKIAQLLTQINELSTDREEELTIWKNRLIERVNIVQNEIITWEKKYLIKSPIDGVISMENKISEGYYFDINQNVIEVIPVGQNSLYGLANMPLINSGEIKAGTNVQIRLGAFPYKEYGVIEGVVNEIALVPKETKQGDYYDIKINLSNKLKTTYDKIIPFTPNMKGTCLIIKEDKSLFMRIYDEISSLFLN